MLVTTIVKTLATVVRSKPTTHLVSAPMTASWSHWSLFMPHTHAIFSMLLIRGPYMHLTNWPSTCDEKSYELV